MSECPDCKTSENQIKIGFNGSGSQRYRCKNCGRKYTPEPKEPGYPEAVRQQAVNGDGNGMNFRRIAGHLGVQLQTVMNWIHATIATLSETPPLPNEVSVIEQDELFTVIGSKKRGLGDDDGRTSQSLYCRVASRRRTA
jgi:transposase-like protein